MDDFKRGAKEWGSKARKAEKRQCRNRIKRGTAKELEDAPINACDAGTCAACHDFDAIDAALSKDGKGSSCSNRRTRSPAH